MAVPGWVTSHCRWSRSNQSWYLVFLVFSISDVYWEPGSQDSCTGVAVGAGAAGVAGVRATGAEVARARAAGARLQFCSQAGTKCVSHTASIEFAFNLLPLSDRHA